MTIHQQPALRRSALCLAVAGILGTLTAAPAAAQEDEEVVITGTRIRQPGVTSSSPIYSINAEEIQRQQEPELEKILRLLPITAPNDGQNVNNGTDGAAVIDLRGLGPQRNLVMINGKRAVPYSHDGQVDTTMIPTALIERIDIVTGGASAVYGSDAMSGALNVILRDDFEGVDLQLSSSQTSEKDGQDKFFAVTLGTNAADGRGNVVLSLGYQERDSILLGARPLGRLGIDTASGDGYSNYLAGQGPTPPPTGCTGPDAVAAGGSTTTLPTRVAIAGGPSLGQFRNDGTLGADCSVFNFNPYNYYQTPLERYNGTVIASLELDDSVEVYSMFNYGKTKVRQQVAPSGIFGDNYFTPLANPFIGAQAGAAIIAAAEAGRAAGTVNVANTPDPGNPGSDFFHNWNDNNGNGVVDAADDLNVVYRRRTIEFGARTEDFSNELFQMTVGARGALADNWEYDASLQYGETNRVLLREGYSNLTNVGNALQTLDGVTCLNGDATCVPLNLFGGFGAITPEMARYSSASALRQQDYEQLIATAYVTGAFERLQLPSASNPIAWSFGVEHRDEKAREIPDECLKLAPSSCLGGAGGFILPLTGGFDVSEIFTEALIPLFDGDNGRSLDLELGYRYSDYDPSGSDDTWKAGINWRASNSVLFRVMQQRAARAPNVGELADPQVQGLSNARLDPCSIANAANITPTLQARCIATGMSAAQVGTVEDIVSGQINTYEGTDLLSLPQIEQADTTTIGVVWTPDWDRVTSPVFSLDYYEIDIENYIDAFSAQEILDACYVADLTIECAKIVRVGGTLTLPGSGVETFTTNLKYRTAEGVELGFSFGMPIGRGDLAFSGTLNKYLTHEFQSSDFVPVIDCNGYFGTSCEQPRPDLRFVQRTTWNYNNLSLSAQWRHLAAVDVEPPEVTAVWPGFRSIDSFDYLDLYFSYDVGERYRLSFGAMNIMDEDPPVVGNEAGDTAFNSGNTFPALYEVLGRLYTFQVNIAF
jgi:outer membrane receptor protein involved in Fe transport